MFKCIKTVYVGGSSTVCFEKDKLYQPHGEIKRYGYEIIDETGYQHIIGFVGEEWFDEHFVDATEVAKDEEYYNLMVESYSEMPNHDEIETKALQEYIKKQLEDAVAPYKAFHDYFMNLYKQGLKVSYWSEGSKSEPFDNYIEAAGKEMSNKWKNSQDGG